MTMSFSKTVLAAVAAIAVSMALVPLADAAERAGGGRGGPAAEAEPTGRLRR